VRSICSIKSPSCWGETFKVSTFNEESDECKLLSGMASEIAESHLLSTKSAGKYTEGRRSLHKCVCIDSI
jgi:hypothetical protein